MIHLRAKCILRRARLAGPPRGMHLPGSQEGSWNCDYSTVGRSCVRYSGFHVKAKGEQER